MPAGRSEPGHPNRVRQRSARTGPGSGASPRAPNWAAGFAAGAAWLGGARTSAAAAAAMSGLPLPEPGTGSFAAFGAWFGAGLGHALTGGAEPGDRAVRAAQTLVAAMHPATTALTAETPQADLTGPGSAYIDSVAPLVSLLTEAAVAGNDADLARLAAEHTAWMFTHLRRGDGSMAQVVTFDASGRATAVLTGEQGLRRDSTWARSQAWGMLAAATAALRCPAHPTSPAMDFLAQAQASPTGGSAGPTMAGASRPGTSTIPTGPRTPRAPPSPRRRCCDWPRRRTAPPLALALASATDAPRLWWRL